MDSYYDLKHGRRLKIIFALSLLGVALSLGIFFNGLSISLTDLKQSQSKQLSDVALGVVRQQYSRTVEGLVSVEEAKALTIDILRAMRFGRNGYYWINDGDGILLMHPYADKYVGTNVSGLVDPYGVQMFNEFIRVSNAGGGLVHYHWPKPNSEENVAKISYVASFEPWGWVIGTGLYTDELEKEIQNYGYRVIGAAFAFAIFFALASLFLTRRLFAELKDRAIKDPLTSLYTRRYLNETVDDL